MREGRCVRGMSVSVQTGVVEGGVCGAVSGRRVPVREPRPVRRALRRRPGAGPADALRLQRARGGWGGGADRGGAGARAHPSARRWAD